MKHRLSKSKSIFALLSVESNMREEVTPLRPLVQSPLDEFWDESCYDVIPFDNYHLLVDFEPSHSFNLSCDEHIGISNKLRGVRYYAFNYFEKRPPKSFKSLYMLKRGGVLSTSGIFEPKGSINYSRLVLVDFKLQILLKWERLIRIEMPLALCQYFNHLKVT